MPRRSIVLLDPTTFLFTNDQFLADLDTVIAKPAAKIFLGYDRPWWEDLGLPAGRSLTDLPLRQCYYWGVAGEQPGATLTDRHALLMPSYNDADDVEFWNEELTHPFRLRPVPVAAPPRPFERAEGQHSWDDWTASQVLIGTFSTGRSLCEFEPHCCSQFTECDATRPPAPDRCATQRERCTLPPTGTRH